MVKLQLSGQDGNAFFILGRAQQVMRQAKVPQSEIDAMMSTAMSGDYDHLLQTVMSTCEKHGIEVA